MTTNKTKMMFNACSHTRTVIDVFDDVCDGSVTEVLVKGLSVGVVIDVLINILAVIMVADVDMLGEGMAILVVVTMIASGV